MIAKCMAFLVSDVGDMILSLACDNVARAMAYRTLPFNLCPVRVRELDWFSGLKGIVLIFKSILFREEPCHTK